MSAAIREPSSLQDYDHKAEMDAQMQRQLENYRRLRREATGQLIRAELQERLGRR